MIVENNMLSAAQPVTASAASANVYDLGKTGLRIGNPLFVCSRVHTTAEADGDATVTIAVQTSDDVSFSEGVTTLYTTSAIGKAALTADSHVFMLDIGAMKLSRYVRGYYTVATGPLTAGKFDLYLAGAIDMH